ncbi:unnamed protein product [Cyprideis torosa]|uniref:Uncharacterized protein n=1 Tax=Cyprideis torosa TaxID=163714 RepID=A0A7R8ZG51_9CRUS|nr:unnamed protein product [Cyprideis torosa]CAG0880807.1 unnamed protein product [Cyprideis torosa]
MTFSLFRWDNCVLCVLVLLPFSLAAVYDCMNEEDVCVPFEDCTDGLLLKNGSLPCGQCDLCIQYLGEGETCSKEFFFTPSSICGPFLTCQEVDVEGSRDACVLMNTTCVNIRTHYIQATFGNGSVVTPEEEADFTGMPRYLAECQDDGKFAPKQCIRDGMCYCVDEDGNRLPGEINTERLSSEANCQCARDWSRLNKLFPKSQAHPLYCSLDGNYREANCAHDEACFCMNPDSLESEGSTVTRRFFDLLPCYDSDVLPSTYPFMERCERLQQQLLENSLEGLPPDTPVIGVQLPTCWPDGKFAPVQKDDEQRRMCSKFAPVQKGDGKFAPVQKGDGKFAPVQKDDRKFAPVQKDDGKFVPVQKDDVQRTMCTKFAPVQKGDGKFAPVQKDNVQRTMCSKFAPVQKGDGKFAPVQKDNVHSKCVKPDGFQIGNYSVPLTDPTAAWQNCFCARAEWLAKEVYEDLPIPDCCPNGNYKNWTCTEKTDGNSASSGAVERIEAPSYYLEVRLLVPLPRGGRAGLGDSKVGAPIMMAPARAPAMLWALVEVLTSFVGSGLLR